MNEKIKNILDTIEKLESRVNAYWNFYTIIVVAVAGWLFSSRPPFSVSQSIALTMAISMFFAANFSVIRAATKRIVAFENELNIAANGYEFKTDDLKNELSNNSMPGRLIASYMLHAVVDVAVIYTIWNMGLTRC